MNPWVKAQMGERSFHCDEDGWGGSTLAERRAREQIQRGIYAGLLGIGYDVPPASVTDIGCGPESLLLIASAAQMAAVDPTAFLPEDEARYATAGITRAIMPAEDYVGPQTEEVWMYNCLQHTIDPMKVLGVVTAHAATRIRIFEWTHVPTDTLHLHRLSEAQIISALQRAGFVPERSAMGRLEERPGTRPTNFYAGVWKRA